MVTQFCNPSTLYLYLRQVCFEFKASLGSIAWTRLYPELPRKILPQTTKAKANQTTAILDHSQCCFDDSRAPEDCTLTSLEEAGFLRAVSYSLFRTWFYFWCLSPVFDFSCACSQICAPILGFHFLMAYTQIQSTDLLWDPAIKI